MASEKWCLCRLRSFAIGDVSGKGVPAALFMALTKTMFKATGGREDATPVSILSQLNGEMCRANDTCMFATVFCCVLDARTGRVEYGNAGHLLPYVMSNGTVMALPRTGGRALGVTAEDALAPVSCCSSREIGWSCTRTA
jgi:sigma-B regulation protein RsbU (phosphoserine phosphatase)